MKKLLLLVAIVWGFSMNAQFAVGGGLSYVGDAGLEINSEFGISDGMITLSPSLDYFFVDGMTRLAFNFDGHYNLGDTEAVNYYPIAGLNYYYFSADLGSYKDPFTGETIDLGTWSDGKVGFDLGFGASYALSDSMKLYGEAKLLLNDYADDFGIFAGVLFNLGN